MGGVTISVVSERLPAIFGQIQEPLCSYITKRAEIIEKEENALFQIFRKTSSKHFAEGYTYDTEMGDMLPVGENGAYPQTGFEQGYKQRIDNMTFKNMFSISREAIDDEVIGVLQRKPDKLLRSFYRGRARLLSKAIGEAIQGNTSFSVNGFSFSTKCMDDKCVFANNHKMKVKGTTQSNVFSDAFSQANLFKAVTQMQSLKDDNGNTLGITPDTIIIPNADASLKQSVLEVVGSMQKPGSANNDINPLFGNFKVICLNYLGDFLGSQASYHPWILFDSKYNETMDGNIYQDRIPLEITSEGGNNDENIWKAYARYGFGFVDFRQMMALGVNGASAM